MTHASPDTHESPSAGKIPSPRLMSGQLTVLSILVAMVPLLCLGTLGYVFHDTAYRAKTRAILGEQAMNAAQSVNAFLEEKISNLRLEAGAASTSGLTDPERLRDRLHALQDAYQGVFLGLDVMDAEGRVIASTGAADLQEDRAGEPWFQQAISRPHFVSSLSMRRTRLFIAVRVTSRQSAWLLRAHLDPDQIDDRIRLFHPGGLGGAFFLDRQGAPGQAPGNDDSTLETASLLARQVFPEGRPVVLEAPDIRGGISMYGCAPVKSSGAILAIHQPREEVLQPLVKARLVGLAIILAGLAGIVTTALALARRTEQRLLKEELNQQHMQRQLVEAGKLAAIGELAAGVAHEINNPVQSILNYAEVLEGRPEDAGSVREFVPEIAREAQRIAETVRSLLGIARPGTDAISTIRPEQVWERALALVRTMLQKEKISVRVEVMPDLPAIRCRTSQVLQVLLNLLINARDALTDPGRNPDTPRHVLCRSEAVAVQGRPGVRFLVRDNGPGIPDDLREHLFEPFFTSKGRDRGTGLGLWISRRIAEDHGGRLWFESTPGEGTTFLLDLPLEEATDGEGAAGR